MNHLKVLWVEDNADDDLYNLTSPVYIDGRFQLDIAINASEAYFYLNKRVYDVVIVDIRIPPGRDPIWRKKHEILLETDDVNSNRLGLELLRCIFDNNQQQPTLRIDQNLSSRRYGVFTVEKRDELEPFFRKFNLEDLKYRHKNAMMPHTALLDFIEEVSEELESRVLG
ncbi:MAG: hypothetical protein DHS20C18_38070 [Saprospiraceae bacterium]|nr:MAG: hypothetical protein DHS20C18_38070 [Saprospiraceae bacterium]